MAVSDIIRTILIADTTDRTAAQARTANSGKWAADSDVPDYMFKSLKTLLGTADSTALARRIVALYGVGKTVTEPSIEIHTTVQDNIYDAELPTDLIGGEIAKVMILFRQPTPVSTGNAYLVEQLELRTRYLLDKFIRGLRGNPQLTVSGDKSIDPNHYLFLTFEKADVGTDAVEAVAQYSAQYVRVFGV
jgi:hypothetical protein